MYLAEKCLHILVERGASDDDLVEPPAEGVHEFNFHLVEYQLVKQRHMQHLPDSVLLQHRTHLVPVNLLYDKRYGNHEVRLHLLKRLHNDLRTRDTCEEMHVNTLIKLVEHLEHKPVHMCGRQHCDDVRLIVHIRACDCGELDVRLDGAVRNHHALRESGSSGSVIDEREFIRLVLMVVHVLRSERLGIFLAEQDVEMFAGICNLFRGRIYESECVRSHNCLNIRHLRLRKSFPYCRVDKQDTGLGMIHKMVYVARLEFMKYGDRHSAVSHRGKEGNRPVHLIPRADCHFRAFLKTAVFEENMDFRYPLRQIAVKDRSAPVVRKCRTFPVVAECLLEHLVH